MGGKKMTMERPQSNEFKIMKDLGKLQIFLFDFLRPSLAEYIRATDPIAEQEWGIYFRAQIALITHLYLKKILLQPGTGYKVVQSWQGEFWDIENGKSTYYEHAWNYVIHEDSTLNMFIDIGRKDKPPLCQFVSSNKYPYHPSYEDMTMIDSAKLNFKNLWENVEDIVPKITKYMGRQTLMREKIRA